MLCVFALSFVACGPQEYGDYPKNTDMTYGNGGLSVRKGNYLFFVNGYYDTAEMVEHHSQKDTYTLGALMMKKLDANGNFVTDAECECFSNKLCGWKATDLHVVGDYLYFTSPCTEVDKATGKWSDSVNRVWFNRVKLNNGDVETFYKSGYDAEDVTFNYYEAEGKHYLLIAEMDDGSSLATIKRIDLDNKFSSTTVSTKAVSYEFKNQSRANDYAHAFVAEKDDKTYSLYAYDVLNNTKEAYTINPSYAVEVKFVAGNYVYITQNDGIRTKLFRANVTGEHGFDADEYAIYDSAKTYFVSSEGTTFARVNGNKLEYYEKSGTTFRIKEGEYEDVDGITGIGVVGNSFVYYDGNKNIKVVDFLNASAESVKTVASSVKDIDTTYFDIDDGDYLYFYNKAGANSNLYLFRIVVGNAPSTAQEPVFFGTYLTEDISEE
ncbi:MAG: hypothetical protein MJ149_01030 [Clostridia bacterium]|nr:hypothetical protein [Clostridia bacterium]